METCLSLNMNLGACILELAQDMQCVVPTRHTAGGSTPFWVSINDNDDER